MTQELVNNVAQREGVTWICHIKSKVSVVRIPYPLLLDFSSIPVSYLSIASRCFWL
jgi:hypothetical protein